MIHLAIADDHELIRNGLEMIIGAHADMKVAIAAGSYRELVDALTKTPADLLILDLNLGDTNGLQTIEQIISTYPDMPILVLSAYSEEVYALRAFKSGAMGYLSKAVVSSELVNAIRTILKGKRYISNACKEILPLGTDLDKESRNIGELLSKRELEVLTLIASDKTSKEIAQQLGVSPKTVSTYKARMMDKLMLESTSQLQRLAYTYFS